MKSPSKRTLRVRALNAHGAFVSPRVIAFAGRGGLFIPGIFFLVIGVTTILAPQLLITLLASFFLFVGFLLCMLAWKIIGWRRRFEAFAKGLEGKIVVRATPREDPLEAIGKAAPREPDSSKKIVIH